MASNDQLEADIVCQMETFTKSVSLTVIGYSLTKKFIPLNDMVVGTFDLGGHEWAMKFSPGHEWMMLSVTLLTETKTLMALEVEYSLLDHKSGTYLASDINAAKSEGKVSKKGDNLMRDYFMKNHIFEKSDYLKDDSFMVKCYVTLVKPVCVDANKKRVIVPSSDFLQHFHQLWTSREGADVTFQLGEETFSAHRTVLAARSPVFKAELTGPMKESKDECIRIKDIKPEVFEILLHFVYTDALPPNKEVSYEMTQHLLIAADWYGLERLRLICEEKLGDCIDVEEAMAILILADRYNCDQLKEVCLDFVASGQNLRAVMATDTFKLLMEKFPSILIGMLEKVDSKKGNN